jgi:hypothetical protein
MKYSTFILIVGLCSSLLIIDNIQVRLNLITFQLNLSLIIQFLFSAVQTIHQVVLISLHHPSVHRDYQMVQMLKNYARNHVTTVPPVRHVQSIQCYVEMVVLVS